MFDDDTDECCCRTYNIFSLEKIDIMASHITHRTIISPNRQHQRNKKFMEPPSSSIIWIIYHHYTPDASKETQYHYLSVCLYVAYIFLLERIIGDTGCWFFWVLVEWNDDDDVGRIAAIFLLMVDIHKHREKMYSCLSFLSLSRVDVAPL